MSTRTGFEKNCEKFKLHTLKLELLISASFDFYILIIMLFRSQFHCDVSLPLCQIKYFDVLFFLYQNTMTSRS